MWLAWFHWESQRPYIHDVSTKISKLTSHLYVLCWINKANQSRSNRVKWINQQNKFEMFTADDHKDDKQQTQSREFCHLWWVNYFVLFALFIVHWRILPYLSFSTDEGNVYVMVWGTYSVTELEISSKGPKAKYW